MADANTIDNIVKPEAKGNIFDEIGDLVINFPTRAKEDAKVVYNSVRNTFNYSLLSLAGLFSYAASGPAGPVTGGAMMLGKFLLNLKKGIKTEWDKLYKEGWKGLILGNLAKLYYQYVINSIPNQTIYGKIGRTLAYNPGFMGGIYNPLYLKATEILDNKPIQKGEWGNLTKRIFKYNSIGHAITTNYIKSVESQVAASALLGTVYRVLAG